MTASNYEIIIAVYSRINSIHQQRKQLISSDYTEDYCSKELLLLVDRLWHTFLRMNSLKLNLRAYPTNNYIRTNQDDLTPWGVALTEHTQGTLLNIELSKCDDEDLSEPYNILEGKGELSIKSILQAYSNEHAFVYYVYQEVIQISEWLDYNPNRFKALNKLISDIQGECFSLFLNDSTYTEAYLLHILCKDFIYWKRYPCHEKGEDPLLDWVLKSGEYNSLKNLMNLHHKDIEWLIKRHIELKTKKEDDIITSLDRALLIVELCQGFEHERTLDSLVKVLELECQHTDSFLIREVLKRSIEV